MLASADIMLKELFPMPSRMLSLLGFLLLCPQLTAARDVDAAAVRLPDGTELRGIREGAADAFKGLRYAQPPLGALRWSPPVMYSYADAGTPVVDATTFGAHCLQSTWPNGSEDCLFLNVFRGINTSSFERLLPVLIFIHGGSYVSGSAKFYSGSDMISFWEGRVVVVTVDYRLNVFGFLGSEDLRPRDPTHSTGNYGLQDQRLAFEWVRQNIAAFGGDGSRITIMGESAGGGSVSNHLVMPKSWGYISAAIIESGALSHWVTQPMQRAQSMYEELLSAVDCADVECLLSIDAIDLFDARVPYSDSNNYLSPYVPTADGVELMTHPWIAVANGDVADVPILHGTNGDEGILFTAMDERYRVNMSELLTYWSEQRDYTDGEIAELLQLYVAGHSGDYPSTGHDFITTTEWWALQRSIGDDMFSCPDMYLSQQIALLNNKALRNSAVFMYHFEYTSFMSSYTIHGAELPYVFHWKLGSYSDAPLADIVSSYWGNFVIDPSHNPNAQIIGQTGLDTWPEYSVQDKRILVISGPGNVSALSGLKQKECFFYISRTDTAIRQDFDI